MYVRSPLRDVSLRLPCFCHTFADYSVVPARDTVKQLKLMIQGREGRAWQQQQLSFSRSGDQLADDMTLA